MSEILNSASMVDSTARLKDPCQFQVLFATFLIERYPLHCDIIVMKYVAELMQSGPFVESCQWVKRFHRPDVDNFV